MRIGIISDLHGNLPGLQVALDGLKRCRTDRLICLGDLASLGPSPLPVVETVRSLGIPVLLGNHETYLLHPAKMAGQMQRFQIAEQWAAEKLGSDHLDWMRSFPETLELEEVPEILFCHGSPRHNEHQILPDTASPVLAGWLEDLPHPVIVSGHTHVQMARPYEDKWLVNPGSAGAPFTFPIQMPPKMPARSEWAVLEVKAGQIHTEFFRVPMDLETLAKDYRTGGMPDAEIWLSGWVPDKAPKKNAPGKKS